MQKQSSQRLELVSRALMSLVYVAGGIGHFVMPQFYLRIMPPWIPWHWWMVMISGVAEVALGVGLWIPPVRKLSAWGIIALLVAVFPANIHMALHPEQYGPAAVLYARLPIQLLLMWWAYWHARRPA
jgi:uncharacterized membrane protein